MPSGFTAPLYEGQEISFEEFVLRCARGMGATIRLRDESLDVLPTEENVLEGDWEERELDRLKSSLDAFGELDEAGWEREADRYNTEAREQYEKSVREREELRARYVAMRRRVEAWEPPTPDHRPLQEFMFDQLTESLQFDCGYEPKEPVPVTGPEHRDATLARLAGEIERAEQSRAEKDERNQKRAEWVRQLRESLEAVPA